MHLYVLLLTASLAGQVEPPPEDVTDQKRIALSESTQKILEMVELLESLGDPSAQAPDEDPKDYFQRVERILKSRALILVKLEDQYEQAIQSKNELEINLESFQEWVQQRAAIQLQRDQHHDELLKRLGDRIADFQVEGTLVTHAFRLAAESEIKRRRVDLAAATAAALDLRRQGNRSLAEVEERKVPILTGEIVNLEQELAARNIYDDPARVLLAQQLRAPDYFQRLGTLTIADLRGELDSIKRKLFEAKYEHHYLQSDVLHTYMGIEKILDRSHAESLRRAQEQIKKSRDVDYQAIQVAILSRYMKRFLSYINVRSEFEQRVRIKEQLGRDLEFTKILEKLTGERIELPLSDTPELFDFQKKAPSR